MNYLKCQRALNDIDRYLRDRNFETTYTHIGSLGFSTYDVKIRRRTIEASRVLYDIDIHPWPTIQAQLDILIYNFESKERKMKNIGFDISRDGPVGKLVIKDRLYDVEVTRVDCDSTPYSEKTVIEAKVTGSRGVSYGVVDPKTTYNPDRKDSINEGKLQIKDVIFNPPATIVFWSDDSKTVVKAENEMYDPEKGLAMAIAKRAMGNQGNYFDTFKKYIDAWMKKLEEALAKFAGAHADKFDRVNIISAKDLKDITAYTDGTERIAEHKKPWKIFYECDDAAYEPAAAGVCPKEYVKKGNAIRAARRRFRDTSVRWVVAQENPWANGEWANCFGSDDRYMEKIDPDDNGSDK